MPLVVQTVVKICGDLELSDLELSKATVLSLSVICNYWSRGGKKN